MNVLVLSLLIGVAAGDYDLSDKLLFPNLPNAAPRSENKVCREESQLYIESLNNYTLWAHKMWDATAKSTTAVLQGNTFHFGSFDECLKIKAPFRTQYCFATINSNVPSKHKPEDEFSLVFDDTSHVLRRIYKTNDISQQSRSEVNLGWCVPASCTFMDLETALRQYINKLEHPMYSLNVSYEVKVNQKTCQRQEELQIIDGADIGFCILTGVLVFMVIAGTFFDLREDSEEEKPLKQPLWHNLITFFSMRKGYKDLVKPEETNERLKLLNGLRLFAMCMVITDHRYGTFISGPIENFDFIEKGYRSMQTWYFFHGDLFVDTFFIMSGILVAYGLLKQFNKKMVNPGFIILLRYFRLTPLYAFVVFYCATMFAHSGSGPFWPLVIPNEVADCKKYWWANLLYISNFIDVEHMCMIHSWYLPCDFHYFIIAIFVMILVKQRKKLGFMVLSALVVLSVLIPMGITIAYRRPALLHFYPFFLRNPKAHTDMQLTYIKSYTRASTYFIGMFAGCWFFKMNDKEFYISKIKSHFLTIVSIVCLFAGMASGAIFYNPYYTYNVAEAAIYAGLHRPLWALGTLGLIFAACFGRLGLVHKFLSWEPFAVLGKLVYGAYLVHMQISLRSVAIASQPRIFTFFDVWKMAVSDIVLSFAVSFGLYILIENPFRKVMKHLLMPSRDSSKNIEMDEVDDIPDNNNTMHAREQNVNVNSRL